MSQQPEHTTDHSPHTEILAPTTAHMPAEAYSAVADGPDRTWPSTPQFTDRQPQRRFDPGVRVGLYLGGVAASTVVLALASWLLTLLINTAIDAVPVNYWVTQALQPPAPLNLGASVWLAILGTLAAAIIMWFLILTVGSAGKFFVLLTLLVTAISTLTPFSAGPWQHALPAAVLHAVIGVGIATLTTGQAAKTTLHPERF